MSTFGAEAGATRNGERREAAARRRRAAWVTVVLLVGAALGGFVCGIGVSPWLRIERITIRCPDVDVAKEAAAVVRVRPGATLVTAPVWRLRREIGSCPRVKDVTISRRWQHALEILVMPREPAVALVSKSDWVLADQEGVYLRKVSEPPAGLPAVRGAVLDDIGPGDVVPSGRMAVAWQCLRWAERLPALGCLSVDLSAPQRVCVYAGDGTKGILGRPTDLGRKLACFAATLQYLRQEGWRAQYVDVQDVRVGAIWRPRPGSRPPSASGEA